MRMEKNQGQTQKRQKDGWGSLLAFAFMGGLCISGIAQAKKEVKVMNKGYDVVAYYKMMEKIQTRQGKTKYKADHDGKSYYFISGTNKQTFTTDPQRYVVPYSHIGLKKQDMVAYHKEKEKMKPVKGIKTHQWEHDGMMYHFASSENREMFKKSPEKYAPLYKGYCAYGVAMKKRVGSNPNAWDIIGGRLYLNLDRDVQERWRQGLASHIKEANENWPQMNEK